MRLLVLALVLVWVQASPALAAEVRVKSKHEKARVQGMAQDAFKVGAEETLRAGVIGPSTARVTLRRIGEGKVAPIPVKLMRDGREVGRVSVGGKLLHALAGETARASAPVTRSLQIPAGPHTLFVEVGAGRGLILVSFDEPPSDPVVAKVAKAEARPAAPAKAEPRVAKAEARPAEPAKAEPKAKAVAKPATPAEAKPKVEAAEAKPAALAKEEPKVAQPTKLEDSEPALPPARPATSKLEDAEPTPAARPESAGAGKLEEPEAEPAATAARPADVPAGPRRLHVFLGPRLGGAAQVQVGALGPAVGLSFRWAVVGGSTPNGTKGLLLGLSADMLRYSIALRMPASSPLGEASPTVTAISVPILVDATYSFGNPERSQLTPFVGVALGLAAGNVKLEGPVEESQGFVGFAVGAHLGLEIPIGDNRLGLEARYLWSQLGGDGTVKELDVGGALFQASWRFGI